LVGPIVFLFVFVFEMLLLLLLPPPPLLLLLLIDETPTATPITAITKTEHMKTGGFFSISTTNFLVDQLPPSFVLIVDLPLL